MNPQPNSHDHPLLIEAMNELDQAEFSLKDYREKKSKSSSDLSSLTYENLLVYKVREAYKKIQELCKYYKIEITQEITLPQSVGY